MQRGENPARVRVRWTVINGESGTVRLSRGKATPLAPPAGGARVEDPGALVRRAVLLSFLLPATVATAFADGKVSGRVTSPEGAPLADIKIVLVSEGKGSPQEKGSHVHLPGKTNKDGKYLFGIVPKGTYTLSIEGTDLVPYSIKLVVYDTDKRQNVVDYQGPAPTTPQTFDVDADINVTYDLVIGDASKSPVALAKKADEAKLRAQEVPGLLQSGDLKGALTRIDEALAASPQDATLHYLRGYTLFRLGDFDPAKSSLQRSLELNPTQPGAHFVLGGALSKLGQKEAAIAEFEKELANGQIDEATKINCYINIGLTQREMGKAEAAIAAFEKVIELDGKQAEAYAHLNELYIATGRPEKAAEVQAKAKAAGAEDPNAVFNIGANYWNHKEYAKAAEYFRHAVELDPKFALAWKNLGYTYVNLGNSQEATEALKKYLDLAPGAEDAKDVKELIATLARQ